MIQRNSGISSAGLEALKKIPAMRYLKTPVADISMLYEKYPDGVEDGSFALVTDENTFYRYHAEKREWEAVGGGNSSGGNSSSGCCGSPGGIGEAPMDGGLYGRKNGQWKDIYLELDDIPDFSDDFSNDFSIEY
jgi:hypothetical protein